MVHSGVNKTVSRNAISSTPTSNGEEKIPSPTGKPQYKGQDQDSDTRSPMRTPQHKGEDGRSLQMADTLNEKMPVGTATLLKPTKHQTKLLECPSFTNSTETTSDDMDEETMDGTDLTVNVTIATNRPQILRAQVTLWDGPKSNTTMTAAIGTGANVLSRDYRLRRSTWWVFEERNHAP